MLEGKKRWPCLQGSLSPSSLLFLSPSSSLSLSPSSSLSVGLTLSRPLLCAFLLQLLFHRPTLSSPAPLQATVLMTRSRVDSLGLCCECVGPGPSHLPGLGLWGGGKGSPAPGTLCGQLIGRNRSIRALPASAVSQEPSVQINRSGWHVLG